MYTSRPGSASPIQRAFTGTEAFKIFQEVRLAESGPCRVNNVVEFGDDARYVLGRSAASTHRLKFTPARVHQLATLCHPNLCVFAKRQVFGRQGCARVAVLPSLQQGAVKLHGNTAHMLQCWSPQR